MMKRIDEISYRQDMRFQNVSEGDLTPADVLERMLSFISQDPRAHYHYVIGTDCQVHRGYTKFVTGLMIRRLGKGVWACYRQVAVPRELSSVKEKLALETTLSQELAYTLESLDATRRMEDLLLPYVYQGASLESFIDIDAGAEPVVNKTSLYLQEMVDRVEAMGTFAVRIKPDAYVASAYANRFTKRAMRLA